MQHSAYLWSIVFFVVVSESRTEAFVATTKWLGLGRATFTESCFRMVPKYDGSRWVPQKPEDMPEAGYAPLQTLLMHGPKPYFTRIFQPEDYEQAVLKFMAADKVGRVEAQGNMDAYLRNPNDWAVNRIQEQRTGKNIDYWTLRPKELILVSVWSLVVVGVLGRITVSLLEGQGFYDFLFKN